MKFIGYTVTARSRDFRRVGRTFERGVATRVLLAELTLEQAAFLAASDPRDLVVEPFGETPPPPPPMPPPVVPTPRMTVTIEPPAADATPQQDAPRAPAPQVDTAPVSKAATRARGRKE